MKKTICDICGKDMPDDIFGLKESIDSLNFAMSRNGKYMDICQDCRAELWKWIKGRTSADAYVRIGEVLEDGKID